MITLDRLASLSSIALLAVAAPRALAAQCPAWQPGFAPSGLSSTVTALEVHDAGAGPELIVGGQFHGVGTLTSRVLRWNGTSWSTFGAGLEGTVYALAHYDAGSGSELYAGGEMLPSVGPGFLGRWNGSTWQALGAGVDGPVFALCTYVDGTGSRLYAGGLLANAGGTPASRIASWNGSTWSALGSGVNGKVTCMAVHDDGTGPALYVGGEFTAAGGAPAAHIARWNGTNWFAVGDGFNGNVNALRVFAGELVAGGAFTSSGAEARAHLARWNGTTWSNVSGGVNADVHALHVHDGETGARLVVGGAFWQAGGASALAVAAWDGTSWSPLSSGLSGSAFAFTSWNDGSGSKLYAGGNVGLPGTNTQQRIVTWDGTDWSPISNGLSSFPASLAEFDDGTGPALYVGGSFVSAGGLLTPGLARWKDEAWSSIPGIEPTSIIYGLCTNTDPSDNALYISGSTHPAWGSFEIWMRRWDGTSLTDAGDINSSVNDMVFFDDGSGPKLHVSQGFQVLRLSGSVFTPLPMPYTIYPRALHVHDDGTGPALYIGGAAVIMRWDGTTVSTVGDVSAFDDSIADLETFDDGTGPALYAAGRDMRVARWNGTSWVQVAPMTLPPITGLLHVFDDGTGAGARLFVSTNTGMFVLDGSTWTLYLATTEYASFYGVQVHRPNAAAPAELWLAGQFAELGGVATNGLARQRACDETGTTFCYGDGSATACPCGNESHPGDRLGCRHSLGYGAGLRARGAPSLSNDGLELRGSTMTNSSALYFQGASVVNGGMGVPFGDGVKCTGGPFVRLGTKTNAGGASSYPTGADLGVSAKGLVTAPGTRHYQVRYRNSADFCTTDTFNYTNAVTIVWAP